MSYDFTPFEVRVTRSRKSMFHFFTECCAILGGIFAAWLKIGLPCSKRSSKRSSRRVEGLRRWRVEGFGLGKSTNVLEDALVYVCPSGLFGQSPKYSNVLPNRHERKLNL